MRQIAMASPPRRIDAPSLAIVLALGVMASACGSGSDRDGDGRASPTVKVVTSEERANADLVMITGEAEDKTEIGGFAFEGDSITSRSPTLRLTAGEETSLVLENVHGYLTNELIGHDLTIVAERDESAEPLWRAKTELLQPGESDLITFTPDAPGKYFYICSIIGHMSRHGMWGRVVVE